MKKTFVIAINAISGGGKTTVTRELQKKLSNSKALYFDDGNYDSNSGIEDICQWIEEGADINLFNLDLLAEDINCSLQENLDYIIIDYPFGYRHKTIAKHINYSVFVDTPFDMALARRILRDYNEDTVFCIFDDMKQYLEQGRNAYLYGLESTKQSADFVIDGSLAINDIVNRIIEKISK